MEVNKKIIPSLYSQHYVEASSKWWARFQSFTPGQHNSKETSQRWQIVGATVSDLTGPGIEPQTSRADSRVFTNCVNRLVLTKNFFSKINFVLAVKHHSRICSGHESLSHSSCSSFAFDERTGRFVVDRSKGGDVAYKLIQ